MFENLLRNSKIGVFRHSLTDIFRRARVWCDWYRELGYTEREMRGIKLLREWLSPEQLVQFNNTDISMSPVATLENNTAYVTVQGQISANLTDMGIQ